ncbi:uncharacterized protein LOC124255109 [Haliotis rubra]|uniref:uncharacterized protein LOC124255109 n=1 Tax=Haliotis rubra TaxID=36100 RepID=UPI001EE60F45|nr:uncharacterized protein LOC124255109 [Haliotis rubra]
MSWDGWSFKDMRPEYISLGFIGVYILLLLLVWAILLFTKRRCKRDQRLNDLSFSILDIAAIYENQGDAVPLRKQKRSESNSDTSSNESDGHSYEYLGAQRPVSNDSCGAASSEESIKAVTEFAVTGRPQPPQPPKKCSTLSGILLKKLGRGWRKSDNRFKSNYKGALARGSVSSNLTNDYVHVDDSRGDSTVSTFETSKMAYLSNTKKTDTFVPDEDENMDIVLTRVTPEEGDDVILRESLDANSRQSAMSTLFRKSWLDMPPAADADFGSVYASAGSVVSMETEGMFIPEEDVTHPILESGVPNIQEMSQNIIDMISDNFSSKNNKESLDDCDLPGSAGKSTVSLLPKTKTLPLSRNLLELHPASNETTKTHDAHFGRASTTSQSSEYDELTSIEMESQKRQFSYTRGQMQPSGPSTLPRLPLKAKTSHLSRNLSDARRSRQREPKVDDLSFPPIPRLSDTYENKEKLLGMKEKGAENEEVSTVPKLPSFPPIPKLTKSPGNLRETDKPSDPPDVKEYPSLTSLCSSGRQNEMSSNETIPIQKRPLPPLPKQACHGPPEISPQPIRSKLADHRFGDRDSTFSDSRGSSSSRRGSSSSHRGSSSSCRGSTSSDDLQTFDGDYQNSGQRPTSSSLKPAGKGGPPPPPPRKDSKLTTQTKAIPKSGPTPVNFMAFSQVTKQLQEKLAMRLPGQPSPKKPDPASSEDDI